MTKIPVIFLPGLAADKRLWEPVASALDDLVVPTFATFEGQSIAEWADHILAVSPERFVVAGISAGGYVALEIALRGDQRVAGVILLNTNARSASPQQSQRGNDLVQEVVQGNFDQVVDRLGGIVAGGKAELAESAASMTRDAGKDAFVRQQKAVLARKDRRDELANITVPVLVIAGDEDRLAPPSLNNEMARLIPAAELEIFPCGHMSTLEVAPEVSGAIRNWISSKVAT